MATLTDTSTFTNVSAWPEDALIPGIIAFHLPYQSAFAPAYYGNTTMGEFNSLLAVFFRENSNASGSYLAATFGTSLDLVSDISAFFGDDPNMSGFERWAMYVDSANSIMPSLPHHLKDPVGVAMLPTFVSLTFLAALCLAARFYSRWKSQRSFLGADWVMLAGFVMAVVSGIISVLGQAIVKTTGVLAWDQTLAQSNRKQVYLTTLFLSYPFVILTIKTSFLLFYYHLTAWIYLRWGVFAIFILSFLNAVAMFVVQIDSHVTVDYWNHYLPFGAGGWKYDDLEALLVTGGFNVCTDFLIWVIPLPLVWKLSLSHQERMLAVVNFGLGAAASIVSVTRLHFLKIHYYDSTFTGTEHDLGLQTFAIIEINVAIIAGCVPYLRTLIHRKPAKPTSELESGESGKSLEDSVTISGKSVSTTGGDRTLSEGEFNLDMYER